MSLCLHTVDGHALALLPDRWLAEPTPEEDELLDALTGPVLDVGCGPARHALALNRRGVVALGIDTAPAAVDVALRRGATVIERSVFHRVPAEGRWRSVLLLDGNIGIGGDPVALLARVGQLVQPSGVIAVEVEGDGIGLEELTVRLVDHGRTRSPWFEWARVGLDGLAAVADRAGLDVMRVWEGGGRWFAFLVLR